MATSGYLLSEEKLRKLNEQLDPSNAQRKKKPQRKLASQPINSSAEILLVQTPDDEAETNGIDALVKKVEGEDYDHPGFAECDVCEITPSITSGKDFDIVPISECKRTVFNLSDAPIEKSKQLLAVKDKFGNWIAAKAASSDIAFELYDDVGPGDVTNAKQAWRLKNSSGSLVRDTDADKIVVNDGVLGDVRAYGSNHSGFSTGAKGWASMEADGKYHVKSIQRLAKTIIVANTASGHAAVAAGTTSFTATFTRVCDDGQPPTVSSPATLVIHNPGWTIDDNAANITCVMDTGTGVSNCLYRIVDAPCPA
jgi:hypothetical protein